MDTVLAKTFLEIVAQGNFGAASDKLHVTQSTVSARVRNLEEKLGRPVFHRSKRGVELTPAGTQFYRYAVSFLRVWEEAKLQVAVPEGYTSSLVVGAQYSLWNRLMLRWLPEMRRARSDVSIRAEIGMPAQLMRELSEGSMDLAVMYEPEHRFGLNVDELFEDELILVSTDVTVPFERNYVFVDWGEGFRAQHAAFFPDLMNPGLTLRLGAMVNLSYVMTNGGAAFFPRRIVQSLLDLDQLTIVPETPVIPYPAFVVYQLDFEPDIVKAGLDLLRDVAARAVRGDLPKPFWAS